MLDSARNTVIARYEDLPSPLQDAICSAYGTQERVRRRGNSRDAQAWMERIESLHWDRNSAGRLVERRLGRILTAARTASGYRHAPAAVVDGDPLARWPILTKDQLRSDPEAYLTRRLRSSDISSLTSGTTGTPIRIWRSRAAFRELFRSSDQSKAWFGVPHWARRASFTGKLVVPLRSSRVWRVNVPGHQLVLSQYHLGDDHVEAYAQAIARWRPWVLDGYTSNLLELARLFREREFRIHVPLVVTTCETLTPGGRRLLREVFGGSVADKYGTSENVVLACECPAGRRHVFQNVGLVEAVDESGQRLPGGQPGRLLLTTLTNDLMPLIRYDVGDVGSLDPTPDCSCGRTSPVLTDIHGREDDVVLTPGGRRVAIFAFQLLRGIEGVVAMQIVQHDMRSFEVRTLLADGDGHGSARGDFERQIRSGFLRLLGEDPGRVVRFVYPSQLERTPGGKIRNVIRTF